MPPSIGRRFTFEAAHQLPAHAGACRNLHGHRYELEVVIDGPFDATAGMIMDFAALDEVVEREVLNDCDHCYLNEFLPNPTVENLIAWIWDRLELKLSLRRIRLWETSRGFAELEH